MISEPPPLPPPNHLRDSNPWFVLQQLDHLFVYYLNTCKEICLNFPLCFWSCLPPFVFCVPTEMLVTPQAACVSVRRLLDTAIPTCIVHMPRACASSSPYSAEYLLWPCLFYSLRSFEAPVPSTHKAQVEIYKKHRTLLPPSLRAMIFT